MANIDTELQTIATSIYGSEMRGAIHDAIEKVNEVGTESFFSKTTDTFSGENSSTGTYWFEKTDKIVTFQFEVTFGDTPAANSIVLFNVPLLFEPDSTAYERIFPITPCPFNSEGVANVPRATLKKSGNNWVFEFTYLNNVTGWQSKFFVSGTYTLGK